jgi:glycosyltransferase involved in cell wall biosynthesis
VVPPGDANALARAIARLADNGEERGRMAAASRARAKNFFEEETMLEAYEEMLVYKGDLSRFAHRTDF